MAYVSIDGVEYWFEEEGRGPLLLLLHGFTGTGRTWLGLSARLSRRFRTVRLDLIGHGRTRAPADPARYSMERAAADLFELVDRIDGPGRPFFLLGYSMGGRIALHAALQHPERVRALVLESASYGIPSPAERAERRRRDDELAASIEAEGVEAFVNRWERLPLFATQRALPEDALRAQRSERLSHTPQGLANALRGLSPGRHASLLGRLGRIGAPVLIVAGELDSKYVEAGNAMFGALPRARLEVIPGAGHNVHLERPCEFERVVVGFLEGLLGPPAAPQPEASPQLDP